MNVQQLSARLGAGQLQLLDVRSPAEFATGCAAQHCGRHNSHLTHHGGRHIPGAVSAPLEELSARAKGGSLGERDAPLAVVCATGARSAQAAVRLKRVLGFTHVTNVRGGTAAWADSGLPLER